MNGNHLTYTLLGSSGLFGVLLLVGLPLTSALLLAVVLACPLMMILMMAGDHGDHGATHDRGTGRDDQGPASDRPRGHQH